MTYGETDFALEVPEEGEEGVVVEEEAAEGEEEIE